jgi:SAM-dependent methyltransferase
MLPMEIHVQSVKEIVKHVALKAGAIHLLDRRRRRSGRETAHFAARTPEQRFRTVYELGVWLTKPGQNSASGLGSERDATEEVRTGLERVLVGLGCRSLVDVGCGDWNWMRYVDLPCKYTGIDIVPEVIEANRHFESSGVMFGIGNTITDPLPLCDVILCREMLFHLSFADGLAALENMRRSARWLLATTDPVWFNSDVRTGDFRRINLTRRPYSLREPVNVIRDDKVATARVVGVWPSEAIPARPDAFRAR